MVEQNITSQGTNICTTDWRFSSWRAQPRTIGRASTEEFQCGWKTDGTEAKVRYLGVCKVYFLYVHIKKHASCRRLSITVASEARGWPRKNGATRVSFGTWCCIVSSRRFPRVGVTMLLYMLCWIVWSSDFPKEFALSAL